MCFSQIYKIKDYNYFKKKKTNLLREENIFSLVLLSKSKFFTRVAVVSFLSNTVAIVLLVLHLHRLCSTSVTLVVLFIFFYEKISHTHTYWQNIKKVLTSYVSLVHTYRRIVWSEDFLSYVLSVNVRTLKIIINLIKHKNTYKRTKTKKAVFLCA